MFVQLRPGFFVIFVRDSATRVDLFQVLDEVSWGDFMGYQTAARRF